MKPRSRHWIVITRIWIAALTGWMYLAGMVSCTPVSAPIDATEEIPQVNLTGAPAPVAFLEPTRTPLALVKAITKMPAPGQAPSHTSTPDLSDCMAAGGRIEIQPPLEYPGMPEGLSFRVYTPPCYAEQPGRRYPALYLIHGQSFTDDQWDRLGAGETTDRLIAAGQAAPFIIVMPRDRVWLDPDADRFGLAFIDVLLPWIDAHYRTIPNREHRAIGGLSRGGAWALHLGLSHWQLFGALGENSGVFFDADGAHLLEWLQSIPPGSLPRIYLDDGDGDRYLFSMQELKRTLDQANVPYTWVLQPGYHNEAYWGAHVEDYLRWYSQEWTGENGQ